MDQLEMESISDGRGDRGEGQRVAEDQRPAKMAKSFVTKMSQDPLHTKLQREKILEAIAKTMLRSGAASASIDEIARLMGRSKGTIYYYFKSRGEMLFLMHAYAYDSMRAAVDPILLNQSIPPRQRLEGVIRAHMMFSCERWQLVRATWVDFSLVQVPPELARQIKQKRSRYEKELALLLQQVVEAEGWHCPHPKVIVRHVFGVLNGMSRWYRKGGQLTAAEVSELAVRLALDGAFGALQKASNPPIALGESVGRAAT